MTEPDGSSCGAWVGLYSNSDSSDATATGNTETFGHVNQTVMGPDKLYVQASSGDSDCTPNGRWQIRVESPDAVTTTDPFGAPLPPPPVTNPVPTGPSYQCRQARKTRNRWVTNVNRTQRQLVRAHGKKRHRLAKKLRARSRSCAARVSA